MSEKIDEPEAAHRTRIVLKPSKLRRQRLWDVVPSLLCVCWFPYMTYLVICHSEMPEWLRISFAAVFSVIAVFFLVTTVLFWNYYARFRFEVDYDGFYCTVPKWRNNLKCLVPWSENQEVYSVPFFPFYMVRGLGRKPLSFFPDRSGGAVPPRDWIENTDEIDAVLETVPRNSIAKFLLGKKFGTEGEIK